LIKENDNNNNHFANNRNKKIHTCITRNKTRVAPESSTIY
jgi:hypothetical protein